jgi:hypothetical protein
MPELYDTLLDFQDAAADAIAAVPIFDGFDIITERQGDLNKRIATSLAKLGLSIVVMTPLITIKKREHSSLVLGVDLVIECAETAMTNRTGIPALRAAMAVMMAIDKASNGASRNRPEFKEFLLDPDRPLQLIPDPKQIVYHVRASTQTYITTN